MTPTLFDSSRGTMADAIAQTITQLREYGERYDHWAIAWSGGKDSTALATMVLHLMQLDQIPRPARLTVLYADTRMELPPLAIAAAQLAREMRGRSVDVRIVLPEMDERFWLYMLGRGVPPPKNDFRWCTSQLKIEPMEAALAALRPAGSTSKVLMLTGVRIGESARRDQTIAAACSKDGAECGQGWLHLSPEKRQKRQSGNINQYFIPGSPEGITDTLAPILHWRVCLVWDWLAGAFRRDSIYRHGFSTHLIADAYDAGEEGGAIESSARTGCICCPLASRDHALERIVARPEWAYLAPLLELRNLWDALRRPGMRLRKPGGERRADGTLTVNQNRKGPLTLEARRFALDFALGVQDRVNQRALELSRPPVDFLNSEEVGRICALIAANTWPDRWTGDEPVDDQPHEDWYADGSRQAILWPTIGGAL